MKQYLILAVFTGGIACHAQVAAPALQRLVETRSAVPPALAATATAPRQLSVQERAELRRQLYQYSHSRLSAKGS